MTYQILSDTAASITDLKKIQWELLQEEKATLLLFSIEMNLCFIVYHLNYLRGLWSW